MNTYSKLHMLAHPNSTPAPTEHTEENLKWEVFARDLMTDPHFLAYINKHGYHFTPALADHVTKHYIRNADGTEHNWTTAQVQAAMESAGMKQNMLNLNWADAAYLANWFYSDEYPDYLKTESDVIKRTHKAANDPDGYEGMTFARWLSDAVGHRIDLDWSKYI